LLAPRRRAAFITAVATVAALAATPQVAAASLLAPDPTASDGVGHARTLYIVMAIIGVLVVLGILGALLRALRSPGNADGEPGRTRGTGSVQARVGIGLGALAIVLFVVGIVFTEKTTSVDAADGADPITIKVDGQQWLWRYQYPAAEASPDGFASDTPYSYHDLVVPVDTPITLEVSSTDVLHRWSVPALAPAVDAVPGVTSEITFTPTETGTFAGSSTRFSGSGYSTMRTVVDVVEPAEYEAFLKEKTDGIKAARAAVQERIDAGTAPGVEFEEK
jgi:cytochrome c oxidase subunit II